MKINETELSEPNQWNKTKWANTGEFYYCTKLSDIVQMQHHRLRRSTCNILAPPPAIDAKLFFGIFFVPVLLVLGDIFLRFSLWSCTYVLWIFNNIVKISCCNMGSTYYMLFKDMYQTSHDILSIDYCLLTRHGVA